MFCCSYLSPLVSSLSPLPKASWVLREGVRWWLPIKDWVFQNLLFSAHCPVLGLSYFLSPAIGSSSGSFSDEPAVEFLPSESLQSSGVSKQPPLPGQKASMIVMRSARGQGKEGGPMIFRPCSWDGIHLWWLWLVTDTGATIALQNNMAKTLIQGTKKKDWKQARGRVLHWQ